MADLPRLWRFSSRLGDLGQWHQVKAERTMAHYVLISRDFAGRPPRDNVGHLCLNRDELERTGRTWCAKARTTFFDDAGREAEQRRMGEAAA